VIAKAKAAETKISPDRRRRPALPCHVHWHIDADRAFIAGSAAALQHRDEEWSGSSRSVDTVAVEARRLMPVRSRPPGALLTYSASVGNPGEALFQLIQLCFCQIFKRQELVAGSCAGSDQLV
jgi:hypothetical protein